MNDVAVIKYYIFLLVSPTNVVKLAQLSGVHHATRSMVARYGRFAGSSVMIV